MTDAESVAHAIVTLGEAVTRSNRVRLHLGPVLPQMPLLPGESDAEGAIGYAGLDWQAMAASELVLGYLGLLRHHAETIPGAFPGAWRIVAVQEVMGS